MYDTWQWSTKPPRGTDYNRGNPLATNLDLYVAFNEAGGAPYDYVTGNQLSSSNFTWSSGPSGPAGSFGGNTDVSNTGAVAIPNTQKVTVLVRALSTNGSSVAGAMLAERESVNATWELFFETGSLIWRGASAVPNRVAITLSGTSYADNKWITYVVTDDGTTATIYMDGVKVGSGTGGNPPGANLTPVHFGNYDNSSYYLTGAIDVGAVWSRALTPIEVASVSANPWQVFSPPAIYRLMKASVGGFSPWLYMPEEEPYG